LRNILFTRDGLHRGRSTGRLRLSELWSSQRQASRPHWLPCCGPLSWFEPDPCQGVDAFALLGEFNLLADRHQAIRVVQPRRTLDGNPIYRSDDIAFGELALG
jgi:hypothetical protein